MANIIQINGYTISSSNGGGGGSDFPYTGSAIISGSLVVTGSTISTLGFTGSLFGTASWAANALTASLASTASRLNAANTSIFAASSDRMIITASNGIMMNAGNVGVNLESDLYVNGSITSTGGITGSLLGTASLASNAVTSSFVNTLNQNVNITGVLTASGFFINPGTNTIPPIELNAGTNLTSPIAGAIEYDGITLYRTNDAASGRGYEPSTQIFRLTASLSPIGPTIANFFGPTSSIQLAGGGIYEIEAYCWFTKTTAGTVTITISSSLAPVNLNGIVQYGAGVGGGVTGAANQIAFPGSSAASSAFGASLSLTTLANHAFTIKLLVESNASNSNLRFLFTESAGTVTPLRGSYYKVTKLPSSNSGNFVA
jgi:hypothetical protein